MRRIRFRTGLLPAVMLLGAVAISVHAQDIVFPAPDGKIVIPSSSIVRPEDIAARRAHTNIVLYIHSDNTQPGPTWETPASIACVYHLVPQVSGCPVNRDRRMTMRFLSRAIQSSTGHAKNMFRSRQSRSPRANREARRIILDRPLLKRRFAPA